MGNGEPDKVVVYLVEWSRVGTTLITTETGECSALSQIRVWSNKPRETEGTLIVCFDIKGQDDADHTEKSLAGLWNNDDYVERFVEHTPKNSRVHEGATRRVTVEIRFMYDDFLETAVSIIKETLITLGIANWMRILEKVSVHSYIIVWDGSMWVNEMSLMSKRLIGIINQTIKCPNKISETPTVEDMLMTTDTSNTLIVTPV